MSSGPFTNSKYEADDSLGIARIRVQPETLTFESDSVSNDPPAGNIDLPFSVYARKPKRRLGVGARSVIISWNGSPPLNYKDENLSIPVLSIAAFNSYNELAAGTYLGQACTIVKKVDEQTT